jgi:hypothetical protein
MKTKPFKLMMMAIALFSIALVAACSDDDGGPDPADDKTELQAKVDDAEELYDNAVVGQNEGNYPQAAKDAFLVAINAAKEILDNSKSTQSQVNSAVANLQRAMDDFNDTQVVPVAEGNLIARWLFNDGTGTTATDASGNARNGTLTVGHAAAGGGGVPTWTTDRHGNANSALHFTKGGHVVVPANTAFSPTSLSLSVWIRLSELTTEECALLSNRCRNGAYMDNYIVSQNAWDGYKFQTQDDRYPFFTLKTALPDTYANIAGNANIPVMEWVHFVVTVTTSSMKFYIDGVDVTKTNGEQNFTGGFVTLADRFDFIIGAERPTSKVDPEIDWTLSHFEGDMDDLRLYNIVLTQAQVTTIYNSEKPATN